MLARVRQDDFNQKVLQASQSVLVEFGAEWCAPCKRLEPILEKLAQEWENTSKIYHIDVEEAPDVAIQFHVMNLPTIILFDHGQEQSRLVGLQSRERIIDKFGAWSRSPKST